ncbi:hypothetical protein [Streptomyces nitrosporeus]|uniref:hypothetical protein n=1 Tax=Streptomyces nitrosporeus TaxID=28894 RepID=UPI00399F1D34
MTLPQLHTPKDIADALQVSTWWVREQAKKGLVAGVKVAGAWRFTDLQYQQLVALHTTTVTASEPATIPRRQRSADAAPQAPLALVPRLPRRALGQ